MTDEMKVAYINAQIVSAQCRIFGMVAENAYQRSRGAPAPYRFDDFEKVSIEFGIHHNAVIGYFTNRP